MIPYAELERAIARWKVRQSGGAEPAAPVEQPAREVSAGAIVAQADAADYAESEEPYAEVSAEQVEHVAVEESSSYVRFDTSTPPPAASTPPPAASTPPPESGTGRRRRRRT